MKNYLLPTALFGTVALIGQISPAMAMSPVEVQQIAKQTTVQIAGCDWAKPTLRERGSGVIIQKSGNTYTVLTVAHVVQKNGCEIVAPDERKYRVTQVKAFPNNIDLAVVNFTSNNNYPVAKLIDNSDRVEAGEPIYVSGFPVSTASNTSVFTFIKGDVISNSAKQQGKGYSLICSNNILPGHSGGPVWNDRGEAIAIYGREDVDTTLPAMMNANVRVNTGYILGITANTFTKLAATAGVSGFSPIVIAPKLKPVDDLIASAIQKERKGDYRGMLADMNQAIFLDSQNSRLYYTRGVAKSMLGIKDAIADYDLAIAGNPQQALAYNNRGVSKSDFGDNKGAIEDFNRAIALDANDANTYYHRGNAKAALNSPKDALTDFNRAIALNPELAPAHFRRGQIESLLGDKKGQLEDFDRAIAINPNYTVAYYQRGLTKSASGDRKGAIEDFNKVIALNPKDPKTYYDRGNAKFELGDNKGALEDFNRTIALNTNHAQAYANRGLVKSKLGDNKGAILDLKKAANRFKNQRQTASYQRVLAEIDRLGSALKKK
jgi:tetratricopeptide (TPR) repeat protein